MGTISSQMVRFASSYKMGAETVSGGAGTVSLNWMTLPDASKLAKN